MPIGFDASCSGLQHYALLARDFQTAKLTNLVQSDAPQDIYLDILKHVQSRLLTQVARGDTNAKWWLEHLDRKVVKGLVMTYCYSSVEYGQTDEL